MAKLTPDGTALVYSTYLGGSSSDYGASIVPWTPLAPPTSRGKPLTRLSHGPCPATCSRRSQQTPSWRSSRATVPPLVYATYLGGSDSDRGAGIAVDAGGEAYITGFTFSPDFPTVHALQPTFGWSTDLPPLWRSSRADGAALIYSTYLGGSDNDTGQGIAVDAAGYAYVTGDTDSPDFPTVHALQPTYGGFGLSDGFVAKFTADGTELVYSTYLGGRDSDHAGWWIAVDATGATYVTGGTASPDFPIVDALQPTLRRRRGRIRGEAHARRHSARTTLPTSAAAMDDAGDDIAVDPAGAAYVTGRTDSFDFPTISPIQTVTSAVSRMPSWRS